MSKFVILLMAPMGLFAHHFMPAPAKLVQEQGRLRIDGTFRVEWSGYREPRLDAAAVRLIEHVTAKTGIPMQPTASSSAPAALHIHCDHASAAVQAAREDESYRLTITPQQARLEAATPLGVLRGMETFLQAIDLDSSGFGATTGTIDDQPRFPWRGFMLDVSRHWMPLELVKRTLDGMASVKLNLFHWHLSDNQGFRVESKRFPKLQGMGSDGHFYTQGQIKELIAYARDRGIRVIPEFDMPGHTTAWFVGYPELASGPGPYQIEREWGIFDPAMDPTRDEVYRFLDGLIGEMAALFPDAYFHIGGDEVNGKEWDRNPRIQEFKKTHGLKTNEDLQAYFTRHVQTIVKKHGKKMIGWDEVLSSDMPHDIMVQSWRGQKALAETVRQGVEAILSNGYYLDLMFSAEHHYEVDPLGEATAGLTEAQKQLILGGEACEWAEFITPQLADSRIWPRLAAIAERLWSPQSVTDVGDMYRRLELVSRDLEWLGLTHASQYHRMLERMAAGGPVAPVHTLAEVVEPVKEYARGEMHPYTSFTPLTRMVDTARPYSETARQFGAMVDARTDLPKMREWLTRWRDNDALLTPVMERSGLLKEDAPISKNLSAIAAAGLEALDYIQKGQRPPAGWLDQQNALLDRAKQPQAELLLSVEPPIRKLIQSAAQ
ncbi:MAG: family 20 glycosylhydrolase [Bryobacteraceae bacterium]